MLIGYCNGYPKKVSVRMPVVINVEIFPKISKMSINLITIDITQITDVKISLNVTFLGKKTTVRDIAYKANT